MPPLPLRFPSGRILTPHRWGTSWALFCCLLASPLQARLGEDEAGCDIRYNLNGGSRQDIPKNAHVNQLISGPNTLTRVYAYEGWVICIGFRDGWAARMKLRHETPPSGGLQASKISDDEIKAILTANTMGYSWREIAADQSEQFADSVKAVEAGSGLFRLWVRADGAAGYILRDLWSRDVLYVEDRAFVKEQRLKPEAPPEKPAPKPIPRF